jgi:hypothetical protein
LLGYILFWLLIYQSFATLDWDDFPSIRAQIIGYLAGFPA